MKTFLVLVAATIVVPALTACHGSQSELPNQPTQAAQTEVPTAREMEAPTDLMGAFHRLDHSLSPAQQAQFLDAPNETRAVALAHHGLGTWMRNEWGLWSGEGPLHDYFVDLGLWHADDMSGVILTSYWRHHHGLPLEVDRQVASYLEYWANAVEPTTAGAPQDQSARPDVLPAEPENRALEGSQ